MSEYLIAYVGEKQMDKEEGMAHRKKWFAWIEGLGDAVVNPGTPLTANKVVAEDGSVADPAPEAKLTGFTVVKAESLDAALAMAQASPYLGAMGQLQVAQIMKMD